MKEGTRKHRMREEEFKETTARWDHDVFKLKGEKPHAITVHR